MTNLEMKKIIEEKAKNGVEVYCVYGNTDEESDLGYSWKYYVDCEEEEYPVWGGEEDETEIIEDWYLYYHHCGNGNGCFGVVDKELYSKEEAYEELVKIAISCGTVEFTDGTII